MREPPDGNPAIISTVCADDGIQWCSRLSLTSHSSLPMIEEHRIPVTELPSANRVIPRCTASVSVTMLARNLILGLRQEHLILVTELLRANLFEFQRFTAAAREAPYFTPSRIRAVAQQVHVSFPSIGPLLYGRVCYCLRSMPERRA